MFFVGAGGCCVAATPPRIAAAAVAIKLGRPSRPGAQIVRRTRRSLAFGVHRGFAEKEPRMREVDERAPRVRLRVYIRFS